MFLIKWENTQYSSFVKYSIDPWHYHVLSSYRIFFELTCFVVTYWIALGISDDVYRDRKRSASPIMHFTLQMFIFTTLVIVTRSRSTVGLDPYQYQNTRPSVFHFHDGNSALIFPSENYEGNIQITVSIICLLNKDF